MRDRVLSRIRAALDGRERLPRPHGEGPDPLGGEDGDGPAADGATVIERFRWAFEAAGGDVVLLPDLDTARVWASSFADGFTNVAESRHVPDVLRLHVPEAPPETAELGVSWALRAAADTGSLVLTSREGRRLQILPPTHLVWVAADRVRARLGTALTEVRGDTASAIALHSGPSKSADIGRILVTGVHCPARVVAAIVGGSGGPGIGSRFTAP